LLLDNNLSPKLIPLLAEVGHDVTHVRDHDMAAADDSSVLTMALDARRVLVSADTDFGVLLAQTHATSPSFVLVRRIVGRRVPELAAVIADNLSAVEADLGSRRRRRLRQRQPQNTSLADPIGAHEPFQEVVGPLAADPPPASSSALPDGSRRSAWR
jgi:predicted nuclease of predicted toxin-antitoxin system